MKKHLIFLATFSLVYGLNFDTINPSTFPKDFTFGTASSSYQTEGGWNADGKGENSWDFYTHNYPGKIADGSNGDVACDSYHKYKEDVALIKAMGVKYYRFSISWARILPTGRSYNINQAGIDYYNNLINELLANDIEPMVTMFHWDLPMRLQELGGATNSWFPEWFQEYADVLFDHFGDRVKMWFTINEPRVYCVFGYGIAMHAPGIRSGGIGEYYCNYNTIKAHAAAYRLYEQFYKSTQKGRVGIVLDCQWNEPKTNSTRDRKAAERKQQFDCGFYANPIFSTEGDYPQIVKDSIAERSRREGFKTTRLPLFTKTEIDQIRGTSDFLGLNYYLTSYASYIPPGPPIGEPSSEKDARVRLSTDEKWPTGASPVFNNVPWGLRKVLNWLKKACNNPEIYITENGFPQNTSIMYDVERVDYLVSHLSSVLDAIYKDGVRVKAYTAWSAIDYFEWNSGYTLGFGLHNFRFNGSNRITVPKYSAKIYADIIKNRKLPRWI